MFCSLVFCFIVNFSSCINSFFSESFFVPNLLILSSSSLSSFDSAFNTFISFLISSIFLRTTFISFFAPDDSAKSKSHLSFNVLISKAGDFVTYAIYQLMS